MEGLSWLDVRHSRFGKGLFAAKNIAAGTIICNVTGPTLTFQQTVDLKERESHCLQIDFDRYILCEAPFLYSNHSCKPNCALNAQLQLFALCDIKCNEELLWDYSTSMLERHWTMPCSCGTSVCRGIIMDFDLLPKDLQAYYLEKKVVLPFIVHHLQTFSKPHVHNV
jgi:SET domain-containing protein